MIRFTRLTRVLLGFLFISLWESIGLAADFQIDVTFQRPAIFAEATGSLRSRKPSTSDRIGWVPASMQFVEVWQSNWSGPQYCGGAYTNSAGQFGAETKFSCGNNLPNDVQLIMRGDSARGFRVGYNSPYPWEQLDVAYAFNWPTPWVKGQSAKIAFGVRRIGDSTNFDDPGFRAAALAEILDLLYQELNLGWLVFPPGPVPATSIWTNWIVNDAASAAFGLSAPWTYNRTVHLPAGSGAGYVLNAAAHELGHALYNQAHSGWDHYSIEVFDYMKSHDECQNYGVHFGSYEGFAHAVYSLAWRQHAVSVGSSKYSDPDPSCAPSSIGIEGNVDEFYSYGFAGVPLERPAGSLGSWTTRTIGANQYAFAPTNALWGLVSTAGMSQENLAGMWTAAASNLCAGNYNGAPKFCGSRRFKCLVKSTMLASTDTFPAAFTNVDCAPGKSNVESINRGADGKYTVKYTASDYADTYSLEVFDNGNTTPKSYAADTSTSVVGVTLTACKPSKMRVRTAVTGTTATSVGADFSITPTSPAWLPSTIAITAVSSGTASQSAGSQVSNYTVTHETAAGVLGYKIYVSTNAGSEGTAGAVHTSNQANVALSKGTTYYLRVQSQNGCGDTMGPQYSFTPDPAVAADCKLLPDGKRLCRAIQPPELSTRPLKELAPAPR